MDKNNYIFFWGGIFSQWFKSNFEIDNIQYSSAEQYMMAEKARAFNDKESLDKILSTKNSRKQKELGRKIKNYDDEVWSKIRYEAVVKGNYAKFTQNENLKNQLLDTGNKIIVEASPYDTIWGIGLSEFDESRFNEDLWRGKNLLGKAIMQVREMITVSEKLKDGNCK